MKGAENVEETGEQQGNVLVCLSPSPSNARIIRTAARMAGAFASRFTALFVETPDFQDMGREDRERLRQNIKLAEKLGASIETVYGDDVPYQIAQFARLSGADKIVLGRSAVRKRRFFGKPPLTERLTEIAPNMDIYIIPDYASVNYREKERPGKLRLRAKDLWISLAALALCTLIAMLFSRFGYNDANIITVYILGVLIISVSTSSRFWGILSSVLSVLIFNFLFTYPRYTFFAYDRGYPLTFAVMFLSALITGGLAVRLKDHADRAALSAYRTRLIFETSQLLQKARSAEEIAGAAAGQLVKLLKRDIVIYPAESGELKRGMLYPADGSPGQSLEPDEAARLCCKMRTAAGAYTDIQPGSLFSFCPVRIPDRLLAVAGIAAGKEPPDALEQSMADSVLSECALALQNEKNAREKRESEMLAENERLRANLLRSVSHDLRTPLTSISGNASNLISNSGAFDEETKKQIYTDIYDDSMWLISLVENLLAVTRIEDGKMELRRTDELLDEIVSEALRHLDRKSSSHRIEAELPDELILVHVDAGLIMQLIINLVDNAVKYTPEGSEIKIKAERQGQQVLVSVSDNGDGIPDEDKPRIFDMFYTSGGKSADSRRSLGLGLNLCRSIVRAHGGEISVGDNTPRGTVFSFTLPAGEVHINE